MVSAIRSSVFPPVHAPPPRPFPVAAVDHRVGDLTSPVHPSMNHSVPTIMADRVPSVASSTFALSAALIRLQLVQLRSSVAASNRRLDQFLTRRSLATAAPSSDHTLGSAEANFVDGSHSPTDLVHSTPTALVPVTPTMNFPEPIRALPAPISSFFGVQEYRGEVALQVLAEMPDSGVPSAFDRGYPQGIIDKGGTLIRSNSVAHLDPAALLPLDVVAPASFVAPNCPALLAHKVSDEMPHSGGAVNSVVLLENGGLFLFDLEPHLETHWSTPHVKFKGKRMRLKVVWVDVVDGSGILVASCGSKNSESRISEKELGVDKIKPCNPVSSGLFVSNEVGRSGIFKIDLVPDTNTYSAPQVFDELPDSRRGSEMGYQWPIRDKGGTPILSLMPNEIGYVANLKGICGIQICKKFNATVNADFEMGYVLGIRDKGGTQSVWFVIAYVIISMDQLQEAILCQACPEMQITLSARTTQQIVDGVKIRQQGALGTSTRPQIVSAQTVILKVSIIFSIMGYATASGSKDFQRRREYECNILFPRRIECNADDIEFVSTSTRKHSTVLNGQTPCGDIHDKVYLQYWASKSQIHLLVFCYLECRMCRMKEVFVGPTLEYEMLNLNEESAFVLNNVEIEKESHGLVEMDLDIVDEVEFSMKSGLNKKPGFKACDSGNNNMTMVTASDVYADSHKKREHRCRTCGKVFVSPTQHNYSYIVTLRTRCFFKGGIVDTIPN